MSSSQELQLGSTSMPAKPKIPLSELLNLNDFEAAAEANLKPKVSWAGRPPLRFRRRHAFKQTMYRS